MMQLIAQIRGSEQLPNVSTLSPEAEEDTAE